MRQDGENKAGGAPRASRGHASPPELPQPPAGPALVPASCCELAAPFSTAVPKTSFTTRAVGCTRTRVQRGRHPPPRRRGSSTPSAQRLGRRTRGVACSTPAGGCGIAGAAQHRRCSERLPRSPGEVLFCCTLGGLSLCPRNVCVPARRDTSACVPKIIHISHM